MNSYSAVVSVASYLPEKVLPNQSIADNIDSSDEWIYERTGIKQRHIANDTETTAFMAIEVAHKLIKHNNINVDKIGVIIVATCSAGLLMPGCASFVQEAIQANNAIAFDINSACSGMVYAVHVADLMMKNEGHQYALVIGSEVMSKMVNWNDRSTSILFGDGAGGFLLKKQDDPGVVNTFLNSYGCTDLLRTRGIINQDPFYIEMKGREVFKHAIAAFKLVIKNLLEKSSLEIEDINWMLPHQANVRIIQALEKHYQLGVDKWIATIDQHANTSSASIPLALHHHLSQGSGMRKGDLVMMVAFGAGFTCGGCLLKIDHVEVVA
ncbi:MAG TPA: beta-ketoacyl-ACP synthase III [Gammaproteobacteria bacterium]|nr:beta-ketoacyl-ACP synthase III [Gammaproteobacteria bacterium]